MVDKEAREWRKETVEKQRKRGRGEVDRESIDKTEDGRSQVTAKQQQQQLTVERGRFGKVHGHPM